MSKELREIYPQHFQTIKVYAKKQQMTKSQIFSGQAPTSSLDRYFILPLLLSMILLFDEGFVVWPEGLTRLTRLPLVTVNKDSFTAILQHQEWDKLSLFKRWVR